MQFDNRDADAMEVTELLVASAEHGDPGLESAVHDVLRLVREKMKVDVVFVRSASSGGHRLHSDSGADPLEAAWGEHMLGERLAAGEAATAIHQSAPVALSDGSVYGTLCICRRAEWSARTDFTILRSTAMLIAQKIDQGRQPRGSGRTSRWGDLRSAAGARPRFEGDPTRP